MSTGFVIFAATAIKGLILSAWATYKKRRAMAVE